MSNVYSYMRISTQESRDLQSYRRQETALEKYAKENNIEYLLSFKEDVSAKNFTDRKEWNKLCKLLQSGDMVVFKDISRFTREAINGYDKYMELMNKGVDLIFIDNQTVSTPYIKQLLKVANEQDLVAKTSLEGTVKLLLIVELDRVTKEREIIVKRIKDGILASPKKSGRKEGNLDKFTDSIKSDIKQYLNNREIKQIDLMKKHNLSRNTLKKYISLVKENKV